MSDSRHDAAVRKKKLAAEYAATVRQRSMMLKELLNNPQLSFFTNLADTADSTIYDELVEAMRAGTAPSVFLSENLNWLFDRVIPERDREIILYFSDRLQEYPYSVSHSRRSFRAKNNEVYVPMLVNILRRYGHGSVVDAPLDQILNRELAEDVQAYLDEICWNGSGYTEWQVAYALDHHDADAEEAIRRILTEENCSGMMTRELVRGVLCSHRTDFHELLGKLLLAARLQEGLRQIICENADFGTKEGFLTILRVIEENRLIRFSSVKRAVGTWLGILTEEVRDLDRISEKSVRLIIDCLDDEALRAEYLASEDVMKIYIALWSYGVDDIAKAMAKISLLTDVGSHHQLLVAGYFVSNLEQHVTSTRMAKKVLSLHHDREDVLAVWLPCFLPTRTSIIWDSVRQNQPVKYRPWFDSKSELREYVQLFKERYRHLSGKSKTFSPIIFPWYEATLAKSDFAELICTLSVLSEEEELLDEACAMIKECTADHRHFCFSALLREPSTKIRRKTALEGLADKESYTRKSAYDIVSRLELTEDEYKMIEDYLRFKSSDIRKYVMAILMRQKDTALISCISRLLDSNKEDVRLGGLDMLLQLKKNAQRCEIADSFAERLAERARSENVPSKEKLLLDALTPKTQTATSEREKLFSEGDLYLPTEFDHEYIKRCAKLFSDYFPDSKLSDQLLGGTGETAENDAVACRSAIEAANDLLSLSRFAEEHKTASFMNAAGEDTLISNAFPSYCFKLPNGKFPCEELWQEWIRTNSVTNERLLRAAVLYRAYGQRTQFSETCSDAIRTLYGVGFEYGNELPHAALIGAVLDHMCKRIPFEDLRALASALTAWFLHKVPDDMVMIHAPTLRKMPIQLETAHFLAHKQIHFLYQWLDCKNDAYLKYTFPLAVASAERCIAAFKKLPKEETIQVGNTVYYAENNDLRSLRGPYEDMYAVNKNLVGVNAYLIAAYQGLITMPQLYAFLLAPKHIRESMETVTAIASAFYEKGKQISGHDTYRTVRLERKVKSFLGTEEGAEPNDAKLIRFVADVYDAVIPEILSVELSRGDSPTVFTKGIPGIARIYGADTFADIVSAMGNDTLDRTSYYGWVNNRKGSLSYLLSVCIPADHDTEETLRRALADKKITDKRLIEAALFSPEWIPIIGRYLKLDAFESVCYYFMAHMNEKFDDKRKAIIARYTPLSDEELNLGAFDINWFRSAYDSIGEKEFEYIYNAAKYISDGAKHSRARKYADAALGRFDVDETEKTVSDKRNKDLLMAYSLIPLRGEDDLCRRYLYIQKFRKESKQFGSQRAVSEGKAAEMALKNLAINAGYADTMRLTLRMETKVIDDSRALLEEKLIDGISFRIVLDENGKASLVTVKDGKRLKSVPAKLKKHETVLSLTDMVKTLTEQYRRTRVMLEGAMEDRTEFPFGELTALSTHPVVYPMLKNLVLISKETVGFLAEKGLLDDAGRLHPLDETSEVRIAHPFDLYRSGCWRNYQSNLFEKKIAQPFRQIFRELYIKTADEVNAYRSLRYAGNQIQPAKTVSTLKSRRWVADIENGLQKVYYKENIVAQIYALADWFSPADIEAPTLEWVCFSDRRTGTPIRIADVPDVIFSEVMRDVDLAVSVAHAGGVDPETSHSTMEMRAAILSFVLPLFRIGNVTTEGNHAIINGTLAEYSVHLGSGVVHQIGGAMIPVLPVHSQHRGKIFLPFVDEDPKTAEIISKVLLFAEDGKIKDPMILAGIRK